MGDGTGGGDEPKKVKFLRQMNLLALLLESPGGVTRRQVLGEMAGEYSSDDDAARRTFERDKEDLARLGVPIDRVAGTSNEDYAYRVDRSRYDQPDPGFEADELAALRLALETVRIGADGDDITRAMWRLGGIVDPDEGTSTDEIIGAAASDRMTLPEFGSLRPLSRAAVERSVVRFDYDRGDRTETRTIEPWVLSLARGRWYVRGHDQDRGAARTFRLDRIIGEVQILKDRTAEAERSAEQLAANDPWNLAAGEQEIVRLFVDDSAVDIVRRRLPDAVEEQVDGGVIFEFGASWRPGLRQFVLELLEHAVVLEPASFREEIIEWLEGIEAAS